MVNKCGTDGDDDGHCFSVEDCTITFIHIKEIVSISENLYKVSTIMPAA